MDEIENHSKKLGEKQKISSADATAVADAVCVE